MTISGDSLTRRLCALGDGARERHKVGIDDLDWTQRPVLPPLVPRKLFLRAIGQFYYGELFAQRLCQSLVVRVSDEVARDCLKAQLEDEKRHAGIYRRYLETAGGLAPPEPALVEAIEATLRWRGAPEALFLACHVLLEGEFLRLDRDIVDWSPCPLFHHISAAIRHDEARHVAFGRIYLRQCLAHLPLAERRAIHAWLKALWMAVATQTFGGSLSATVPAWTRRNFAMSRWPKRAKALQKAGLFSAEEAAMFGP